MVVLVSPDNSISKWHGVFALNPLFTDGNDCFIKHVQNQFLYTQVRHTSSLLDCYIQVEVDHASADISPIIFRVGSRKSRDK